MADLVDRLEIGREIAKFERNRRLDNQKWPFRGIGNDMLKIVDFVAVRERQSEGQFERQFQRYVSVHLRINLIIKTMIISRVM